MKLRVYLPELDVLKFKRPRFDLQELRRRIARDRIGREILHHWKWARQSSSELWQQIDLTGRINGRILDAQEWMDRIPSFRLAALSSGLGGVAVLSVVILVGVKIFGPGREVATASVSRPSIHPSMDLAPQTQPALVQPLPPPLDEIGQLKLALANARERCLNQLYGTPEYKAAKASADELESTVLGLRQSDPLGELPRISTQWIQAKAKVTQMTSAALKSDATVQKAELVLQGMGIIPIRWQSIAQNASSSPQDSAPPSTQPQTAN